MAERATCPACRVEFTVSPHLADALVDARIARDLREMNGYYELCRCGHTRYRHTWVPDPANPEAVKRDCQQCCCSAFDGTGEFDMDGAVNTSDDQVSKDG